MAKRQKPSSRSKKPFPPLPPAVVVDGLAVPDLPFRLLSKKEVRAILGISEPTLWDWVRKGHLAPARVIGPNNSHRAKQGWLSTDIYNHIAKAPTRRLKPPQEEQ
jgi:predicted DNA-binding transcriptional regulator AlpA